MCEVSEVKMYNILKYLRDTNNYSKDKIRNFLRADRVKYFIAKNNEIVIRKKGRHSGGTLFSEGLFKLFKSWIDKEPIGLLNRKEFEINDFIKTYFEDCVPQYKIGKYLFDWFIPSIGLIIEFDELTHGSGPAKKEKDRQKILSSKFDVFIIKEKRALVDCAILAKKYPKN